MQPLVILKLLERSKEVAKKQHGARLACRLQNFLNIAYRAK